MAKRDKSDEGKGHKRRRCSLGGLVLLIIAGAVAALVVSEPLRNKVLDALFGAEEEFQYTPPAETSENGASGQAAHA
ncbi:MAG: hypothetical protein ACP5H2_00625 [Solirubrobacteraceae bacterium]